MTDSGSVPPFEPQPPAGWLGRSWATVMLFWRWLNKHIEVLPKLKTPIGDLRPRTLLGLVVFVVLVLTVWLLAWNNNRPRPLQPSIAVFLPDWRLASDGPFYQDGLVQKRGFDKAERDTERYSTRLSVMYEAMRQEETADELLARLKKKHAEGALYFVMTMSSKVELVRDGFIRWREQCAQQGKRAPVLIATVASAPDLADSSNGILRWYVRSDEESELIATYLRWKRSVERACVFYITRTPGQADDSYGKRGMEVFRDRFMALGGVAVDTRSVTADTAGAEVASVLDQYRKNGLHGSGNIGAFVVGYGRMVSSTLDALIAQGFDGQIACTSTLTEPDWQPVNRAADNRIVTVLPRMERPQERLDGDDRNVVYFFAKATLTRVRRWTAEDPDPAAFLARWGRGKDGTQLREEYVINGDVVVHLEVVEAERWR